MANITKNLDTIVAQAINGPKVDGIPLYTRLDGEQEGFTGSVRSDKWERASKTTYTSPTNIRRVFISGTKVVIQTYKPAIIRGKPDSQGCWREFSLEGENNLINCAMKSMNYDEDMRKYFMEKQINPNAKEPDRVTMRGTGLGALSKPWVVSNVEEVYFDWTLLTGDMNRNAGVGCEELLVSYFQGKRGYLKLTTAIDLFTLANLGNSGDIKTRFPRLRCVGIISELGKILNSKFDKGRPIIEAINNKDNTKLWCTMDDNINLIRQSNSLIMMNEVRENSGYNLEYSIRAGVYKYDDEILQDYFEDYEKKVKENTFNMPDKHEGRTDEESLKTNKSELEYLLDSMIEAAGQEETRRLLLISLAGANIQELNKEFNEMSAEGEKRYRDMMN